MSSPRQNGSLIVFSGFAGVGKGTVLKEMFENHEGYAYSVSATTRASRPGEKEGIHYFFLSKERFEDMIRNDELLEYTCYVGNYYGTPKAYVEKKLRDGFDVILEIETEGALNIKKKFPEAILIYLLPPDAKTLKERLVSRGTETPEMIRKRLARAYEEAGNIRDYDYIIVNDNAEECAERLHALIRSQRSRVGSNRAFIEQIRSGLLEVNQNLE